MKFSLKDNADYILRPSRGDRTIQCDIAEGGAANWQVCVASSRRRFHEKTIFRTTENRFSDVWGIRNGISKFRIQADMNGPASAGTRMSDDPAG